MNTVLFRRFDAPPIDRREIERYAGVRGETSDFREISEECLTEMLPHLTYGAVWREFPLRLEDGFCADVGFARISSESLYRHLTGCESVAVFAATVGPTPDRLILKYGRFSPVKALFFQAIGAERIEALCDEFCRELEDAEKRRGLFCRSRFSPGYGDCPMTLQREILQVLEAQKYLGLTLNDSLLMSPNKSVTAIVGISSTESRNR